MNGRFFSTFVSTSIKDFKPMNILTAIIDGFVDFVRRNPILCLAILLLVLFAPSVAGGIAMFILYFILGIILLGVILMLSLRWRINRARRQMEEQFRSGGQNGSDPFSGRHNPQEGDIRIHKMEGSGEKRVRKDVGDYVDFEEIGNDSEQKAH